MQPAVSPLESKKNRVFLGILAVVLFYFDYMTFIGAATFVYANAMLVLSNLTMLIIQVTYGIIFTRQNWKLQKLLKASSGHSKSEQKTENALAFMSKWLARCSVFMFLYALCTILSAILFGSANLGPGAYLSTPLGAIARLGKGWTMVMSIMPRSTYLKLQATLSTRRQSQITATISVESSVASETDTAH